MNYQIVLEKSVQKHIIAYKRSGNVVLCRKIENLLLELTDHPREGDRQTGNVERRLGGILVAADRP